MRIHGPFGKIFPETGLTSEIIDLYLQPDPMIRRNNGGLAQLARALAWHARGHEFDSRILHSV